MAYNRGGINVLEVDKLEDVSDLTRKNSGYQINHIDVKTVDSTTAKSLLNYKWLGTINFNDSYFVKKEPFVTISRGFCPTNLNNNIFESTVGSVDRERSVNDKKNIYISYGKDPTKEEYKLSFVEQNGDTFSNDKLLKFDNIDEAYKRIGFALCGGGGGGATYADDAISKVPYPFSLSSFVYCANGSAGATTLGVLNLNYLLQQKTFYIFPKFEVEKGEMLEMQLRDGSIQQKVSVDQEPVITETVWFRYRIEIGHGGHGIISRTRQNGSDGENSTIYLQLVRRINKNTDVITTKGNFNNWELVKEIPLARTIGGQGGNLTDAEKKNYDTELVNYKRKYFISFWPRVTSYFLLNEDLVWIQKTIEGESWQFVLTPSGSSPETIKLKEDIGYPTFYDVKLFDETISKLDYQHVLQRYIFPKVTKSTTGEEISYDTSNWNEIENWKDLNNRQAITLWYDQWMEVLRHKMCSWIIPGGITPFGRSGCSMNSVNNILTATNGGGGGSLLGYPEKNELIFTEQSNFREGADGFLRLFY